MNVQSKNQSIEIFLTCQKNRKLNVIIKSSNKIRNALRFKNQISTYMNSNVIYKFKWNVCSDDYTGETKCHFLVRENEHLVKHTLITKNLKYIEKDDTAVRKHCHNHCHTDDSSCFSLVGIAPNKYH